MSVRELTHDRLSRWFSKSRGMSASVSFLSSPPLPALLLAPLFAWSLTLVPRSFLLNRTETLATQARCPGDMSRIRYARSVFTRAFRANCSLLFLVMGKKFFVPCLNAIMILSECPLGIPKYSLNLIDSIRPPYR